MAMYYLAVRVGNNANMKLVVIIRVRVLVWPIILLEESVNFISG